MNQHNANLPSSTLFPTSHSKPTKAFPFENLFPSRTLVVLVPDCELDIVNAARKVWELAYALECRIQLLGLCSDILQEPCLRRQLVTMSAMVENGNGSVDSRIEFGKNWLKIVKSNWRTGDVIVCLEEQRTGLMKKPLSKILEANLNATVYVLSGLNLSDHSRAKWFPGVMAWAGLIGIIAAFFWVDVKIAQMTQDWAHTALLYFALFLEVGLLWVWNSFFS